MSNRCRWLGEKDAWSRWYLYSFFSAIVLWSTAHLHVFLHVWFHCRSIPSSHRFFPNFTVQVLHIHSQVAKRISLFFSVPSLLTHIRAKSLFFVQLVTCHEFPSEVALWWWSQLGHPTKTQHFIQTNFITESLKICSFHSNYALSVPSRKTQSDKSSNEKVINKSSILRNVIDAADWSNPALRLPRRRNISPLWSGWTLETEANDEYTSIECEYNANGKISECFLEYLQKRKVHDQNWKPWQACWFSVKSLPNLREVLGVERSWPLRSSCGELRGKDWGLRYEGRGTSPDLGLESECHTSSCQLDISLRDLTTSIVTLEKKVACATFPTNNNVSLRKLIQGSSWIRRKYPDSTAKRKPM